MEKQSPLKEDRALQKKCKRVAEQNPELTLATLSRRLKVGTQRLKELLSDKPSYPTTYKQTAGRLNKDVEEVSINKEAGREWCPLCKDWLPREEFNSPSGVTHRHTLSKCTRVLKK